MKNYVQNELMLKMFSLTEALVPGSALSADIDCVSVRFVGKWSHSSGSNQLLLIISKLKSRITIYSNSLDEYAY